MHSRRTLTDWSLLALISLIWGGSFVFTKHAVTEIPAATVAAGRLGLAAVVLTAIVRVSGLRFPRDPGVWVSIAAMAVGGTALPFYLVTWGQVGIDSGLAGVLMAVMPIATLLMAHYLVDGEPLTYRRAAGFALGFAGIVVLVGPAALLQIGGGASTLLHQSAVLAGALCYAVNTIIARRVPPTSALVIAAAVMCLAAAVAIPVALWVDRPWHVDAAPSAVASVVYLGLVSTALAETVYFRLIALAGATFVSVMNYLIPLVAVLAGIVVLGERPGWNVGAALVLILGGIAASQTDDS